MNSNYEKSGEVKANRGKLHEYLGMNFYFIEKEKVKIYIYKYVERMINELPTKISKGDTDLSPSGNDIFEKDNIKRLVKK